jgi:hypothetical protein
MHALLVPGNLRELGNLVKRRLTGDLRHSLADITLAQRHFGYSADVSFEVGLKRT